MSIVTSLSILIINLCIISLQFLNLVLLSVVRAISFFSYEVYHQKTSALNLEQFPPTSNAILNHIYRAYLQAFTWYHAAIEDSVDIDPELYGFKCDEDENMVPVITDESKMPGDFPSPCKFIKCKSGKTCSCRRGELSCCEYCKCKNLCLNPLK